MKALARRWSSNTSARGCTTRSSRASHGDSMSRKRAIACRCGPRLAMNLRQPRLAQADQQLRADQDHQRAADRAADAGDRDEGRQRRHEQQHAERALAEAAEHVAQAAGFPPGRRPRTRPAARACRLSVVRRSCLARGVIGVGVRASGCGAAAAACRCAGRPGRPPRCARPQSKCSPTCGMRPKCAITMPAAVW